MIRNKIVLLCLLICLHLLAGAQTPAPVKWLLQAPYMRGASFSLVVKDVQEGRTVYSYDTDRLQSPASVLKTVATATALEILGEDYRYPTTLEYDGILENGTLEGNLLSLIHISGTRSTFSINNHARRMPNQQGL